MNLEEVMSRNYTFIAKADLEAGGWVVVYPDLPGVMTQADSYEEISEVAKEALASWAEAQIEDNLPIPEPSDFDIPAWSNWNSVGEDLLTTKEVAERLNVTPRRVLALAADRGIGERFGRSVMFHRKDVEAIRPGPTGRPRSR